MTAEPKVIVAESTGDLARQAAELFVRSAQEGVRKRGKCFVALSGGSTPRAAHHLLAEAPFRDAMPWRSLHLFWVDDRCVPYEDPASNFGAAKRDLLDRIVVPGHQIHPMPTMAPPRDGAETYGGELKAWVPLGPSGFPRFDLIFLGMGDDGHTASLFPGQQALEETRAWVVAVKGGNPDVHRLTVTLPVLNQARSVVFLVSGEKKATVLKAVLEGGESDLPAARVRPADGSLAWLVDRGAAGLLSMEVLGGSF